MLKEKILKGKKPFFNFSEKGSFLIKPADASVTTVGAGWQAPMVFGQAKGNSKSKKTYFYYFCGKEGHVVKNC